LKLLSWVITLPLLAVAAIFAVSHRQRVTVDLWPLPVEVAPPLYLLVLVGIFLGFVAGGLLTWISQGKHRRRARDRRYRMERLERDLKAAQRDLDALRAASEEGGETAHGGAALPGRGNGRHSLPSPRANA
jgi:uncharacterized integral membrane protein